MNSTIRISDELNRCAEIRFSLIELYVDSSIWGYANRMYKSAKDIMTLYALEKALYNAVYYSFSETNIEKLIFMIREYLGILSYKSKVDYYKAKYPDIICPDTDGPYTESNDDGDEITYIINNFYPTTNIENYYPTEEVYKKSTILDTTEWHKQELTPLITVDGQTEIPNLNFDISNVDVDTIRLEVQGDDSQYTTTGVGYHVVGNTLYWHSFYDLKTDMQVTIKWRD